jgi:hypothetical protein
LARSYIARAQLPAENGRGKLPRFHTGGVPSSPGQRDPRYPAIGVTVELDRSKTGGSGCSGG